MSAWRLPDGRLGPGPLIPRQRALVIPDPSTCHCVLTVLFGTT